MEKGLFEVFGDGLLGPKAEDLNTYADLLAECGLIVPKGMMAIATGIFNKLVEQFSFPEGILPEQLREQGCPNFLLSINREILSRMEIARPYAIRSAALSERGGTGIYKSTFFWPTGNQDADLEQLWYCECQVYVSEFSADARLWRERFDAPIGMSIIIHAIVGFSLDESFLPEMAGTAYTLYQGLPTVRAVVGFGTKAVGGEGVVYNRPEQEPLELGRHMWDQQLADAVGPRGLTQVSTHSPEIYGRVCNSLPALNRLFESLAKLRERVNLYLEWVILEGQIFVVQCAAYKDRLLGDLSFDSSKYFALLEGKDVLHSGRATCKIVVYVRSWSVEIAHLLAALNEQIRDYLLVIPQDATSRLADHLKNEEGFFEDARLAFRHFSNALAVVERQHHYSPEVKLVLAQSKAFLADHSEGLGASHFAQLCDRANILFIGAQFDAVPLFDLPGMVEFCGDDNICIWETQAEVVVNATAKSGFVYISNQPNVKHNEFSQSTVQGFGEDLRQVANQVADRAMSGHLYNLAYAIGPNTSPIGYDQFELDRGYLNLGDAGGLGSIVESLKAVLARGAEFVSPDLWEDGLKDYLQKLLTYLTQPVCL